MHRYLLRRRRDSPLKAGCLRLLEAGPWGWPGEDEPEALDRARGLVDGDVPLLVAGATPLLVVDGQDTGWVWFLSPPGQQADRVVIGAAARAAWGTAESLLPRVLPVIWRSVSDAVGAGPAARCGGASASRSGVTLRPPAKLDGASFGLSFLLGLASSVLDEPLPPDLAASAVLCPDGSLGRVNGLQHKIRVLEELCPRVTRLLVAQADVEEATRLASGGLELVGCRGAKEAFSHALPSPEEALLRLGQRTSPADRPEHVRAFFRLATGHRQAFLEWSTIARAAEVMRDRWEGLGDLDRLRLEIAQRVAERHAGRRGRRFEIPKDVLAATPQPERTELMAQTAQQAADCSGTFEGTVRVAADLEGCLVEGADGFPAHLKLQGALARIWAVTGRPRDALVAQERSVEGFIARYQPSETSHPLSELFRLSGALGDADAYERACELRRRTAVTGAYGQPGSASYVDAAQGRALVELARYDEAEPLLRGVIASGRPTHLVSECCRNLVLCLNGQGRESEASEAFETLVARTDLEGDAGQEARWSVAFAKLRGALARGDEPPAAERALEELRAGQAGPVGHLEEAATRLGENGIRYVARFFPY